MLSLWRKRMQRYLHRVVNLPQTVRKWLRWKYDLVVLTFQVTFYNEFMNGSYMLEVFMEPMVWVVDHFTKALGPILVGGVIVLTSTVVFIVYWVGLPYYWNKSKLLTSFLIVLGHWLLINVVFHFFMAAHTDPGTPPQYGGTTGSPVPFEPSAEETEKERIHYWYRFSIMYCGMITTGVFFSLGGLASWHSRLISRGETSIEAHINKKETERLVKINQIYKNPYDFGAKENWRIFLGMVNGRGLLHVLFPSTHLASGNGLTWPNSVLSKATHDKAA